MLSGRQFKEMGKQKQRDETGEKDKEEQGVSSSCCISVSRILEAMNTNSEYPGSVSVMHESTQRDSSHCTLLVLFPFFGFLIHLGIPRRAMVSSITSLLFNKL